MNEQASWKGHSFTLLVFGGIVFLCSIFFVLGMLVGRGPGSQHTAEAAAASSAAADTTTQEEKSSVSSFDRIEPAKEPKLKETPPAPAPVKANAHVPDATAKSLPKPAPPPPAPAKPAKPEKAPVPVNMIYLQVAALEKDSAARKQLEELRKAGFPAVIMSGDGANSLFRVQVGPFSNAADAEISKRKLEALGYKPIKK
jgi:DedD protein